jgi:hypothetical protein
MLILSIYTFITNFTEIQYNEFRSFIGDFEVINIFVI